MRKCKILQIAVITVEPAVKYYFVFKKYANELGSIQYQIDSFALFACQTTDICNNCYWSSLATFK